MLEERKKKKGQIVSELKKKWSILENILLLRQWKD
jgi:hypothetical protein